MRRQQTVSSPPRVVRVDVMPLDCGDGAAVIELDHAPDRGWHKAFKRVLAEVPGLESVQARCDGRFVYIVGIETGRRGAHNGIMQAFAETEARRGARQGRAAAATMDAAEPLLAAPAA